MVSNTAHVVREQAAIVEAVRSGIFSFLDYRFYNNSVHSWLIALAVAIVVMIGLVFIKRIVHNRLKKFAERTTTDVDDLIAAVLGKTRFFFFLFVGIYFGSRVLELPPQISIFMGRLTVAVILFQAAVWISQLLRYFLEKYQQIKMAEESASAKASIAAISFISRLVLWVLITILALDNMGFNISTLVAGLGVGGIAVALAAQNILGDLFASFLILLDKPFVMGDFIIVGEYMGVVETVGLKTTRIRSLGGEQLVFSNQDLLKSRIRNYKRMVERRVVFGFGITYDTPYEKVEAIPGMVEEIINSVEQTRFDRAHFFKYGDSSLDFEVVYYSLTPDYNIYMDIQQQINLGLMKRFEEEKISFAFPTHTVYVEQPAQS